MRPLVDPTVKNLIFDLGGVLLDLHLDRTHTAFATLAGIHPDEIKRRIQSAPFFDIYEKGLLSDNEFRTEVRKFLRVELTDGQIDDAWNEMLGELPKERLDMLKRLKGSYRTFLLSNTNNIHLEKIGAIVSMVGNATSLNPYFEVDYYSHLLKMRKPDREIFDHVVAQNGLVAGQTLFLDDNIHNLKGAAEAGLQTFHVQHPRDVLALFP